MIHLGLGGKRGRDLKQGQLDGEHQRNLRDSDDSTTMCRRWMALQGATKKTEEYVTVKYVRLEGTATTAARLEKRRSGIAQEPARPEKVTLNFRVPASELEKGQKDKCLLLHTQIRLHIYTTIS